MMKHLMSVALILLQLVTNASALMSPNNGISSSISSRQRHNTRLHAAPATSSNDANLNAAKSLIANAISLGAPAYNAGDIDECARIYRETALEVAPLVPVALRKGLEEQANVVASTANEEAWALRKQFDAIFEYQPPFMPTAAAAAIDDLGGSTTKSTVTLEPFDTTLPSEPLPVLDNVMGGMSQGRWIDNKRFVGTTSLQNNGGFASLRWRFDRIQNWSYARGVYLRIDKHDPIHTFRLILKDATCEQVRGANFKTVFGNPNDDGNDDDGGPILIPFAAFNQMEQMGRALMGPSLNPATITEIGFMAIKPTVVGDFELVVNDWGLYF